MVLLWGLAAAVTIVAGLTVAYRDQERGRFIHTVVHGLSRIHRYDEPDGGPDPEHHLAVVLQRLPHQLGWIHTTDVSLLVASLRHLHEQNPPAHGTLASVWDAYDALPVSLAGTVAPLQRWLWAAALDYARLGDRPPSTRRLLRTVTAPGPLVEVVFARTGPRTNPELISLLGRYRPVGTGVAVRARVPAAVADVLISTRPTAFGQVPDGVDDQTLATAAALFCDAAGDGRYARFPAALDAARQLHHTPSGGR